MTIHIISVGVNLLQRLADPAAGTDDVFPSDLVTTIGANPKAWRLLDRYAGSDRHKLASQTLARWFGDDPGQDDLARGLEKIQPGRWGHTVSAEVATFYRVAHCRDVPVEDVAVLLATDTADGLLAAAWNALALVNGDRKRIRYRASPTEPLGDVRGTVLIVRVPDMDARDDEGFRRAMGGLGTLGRALLPLESKQHGDAVAKTGERFHLYLSGGFKAAIPYLIGLAEGLRSVREVGPVEAYVLHETTASPPIRLPLRRMTRETIVDAVSGYNSDGVRSRRPAADLLDGYAFEKVDGRWRRTAFGEGLATLFGLADEVLPG